MRKTFLVLLLCFLGKSILWANSFSLSMTCNGNDETYSLVINGNLDPTPVVSLPPQGCPILGIKPNDVLNFGAVFQSKFMSPDFGFITIAGSGSFAVPPASQLSDCTPVNGCQFTAPAVGSFKEIFFDSSLHPAWIREGVGLGTAELSGWYDSVYDDVSLRAYSYTINGTFEEVPEPCSILLAGSGVIAVLRKLNRARR